MFLTKNIQVVRLLSGCTLILAVTLSSFAIYSNSKIEQPDTYLTHEFDEKLAIEFVRWWIVDGLNFAKNTAEQSHEAAAKWTDLKCQTKFREQVWLPALNSSSGKTVTFMPLDFSASSPEPDGSIRVKVIGALLTKGQQLRFDDYIFELVVTKARQGLRVSNVKLNCSNIVFRKDADNIQKIKSGELEFSAKELDAIRLIGAGQSLLERGRKHEALEAFRMASELNLTRERAHFLMGKAYLKIGLLHKALNSFNEILKLNPRHTGAWCNRGNINSELGNHRAAFEDFKKIISIDPDLEYGYNNLGTENEYFGDDDEAFRNYSQAIKLEKETAAPYENRARILNQRRNFSAAIKDCTSAITLDPTFGDAYGTRGGAYCGIGNFSQAIADCSKAIDLDSTNTWAYTCRSQAYLSTGKLASARQDLNFAITLEPQRAGLYAARALVLKELGLSEQSFQDLEYAAKLKLNKGKGRVRR